MSQRFEFEPGLCAALSPQTADALHARTTSTPSEAVPNRSRTIVERRGWCKLGRSAVAPGDGLMVSHAMLPTPLLLADRIRVYFAACDADLRGRVFYADLERTFPFRTISICRDPVLDIGSTGSFDADGVNPSQIIERDGKIFMYYIGWQRISREIPYTLFAGLAVSTDGGASFKRVQSTPVLAPTQEESYFRTAPFVWLEQERWQVLYIGGSEFFTASNGKRLPRYALRHMESQDGLNWTRASRIVLEPSRSTGEIGFGRPVLTRKTGFIAELMLSVRTIDGYTLRSGPFFLNKTTNATSMQNVLPLSPEGWDSEMTCFGVTLAMEGGELLIYNGNQFGRSGFGLAWRWADAQRQGRI